MQQHAQRIHNGHNNNDHNSSFTQHIVPWPEPMNESGMWGIAGEYVRLVEEHTEGDRNIILLAFLAYAGNYMGRNFYVRTGADRHYPNLYLCPVGTTGTGRKGSGVSAAQAFFTEGNCPPKLPHLVHGVSSGEGLMNLVRDARKQNTLNKKNKTWDETVIDPGVPDKRLMVTLGEFQQYLAAMRRQESILSSVLRQAWDTGRIASPSKNNEISVSGAHISLIGCISKEELLAETLAVDAQNGTLNRFLFACSRRSRLLPEGGDFDKLVESAKWGELQEQFSTNIQKAMAEDQATSRIDRDSQAQDEWGRNQSSDRGLYKLLSQPRIGLWGTVTARGAQQVIRLSMINSVINGLRGIPGDEDGLRGGPQTAAIEQWRFCDHSARYIFGDRMDDPVAIRIMDVLREAGTAGMTRTSINDLVRRSSDDIQKSLSWLSASGLAYCQPQPSGGRPVERWYAAL